MATGQAVPRQPYGVVDFNVRDVDRHRPGNIVFTSRDRAAALAYIEERLS